MCREINTSFSLYVKTVTISYNVLKSGLNWSVKPVGPETGEENVSTRTGFMSKSEPE